MTRDIFDRIQKFIYTDFYQREKAGYPGLGGTFGEIGNYIRTKFTEGREPFEVRRIALNMDQVHQYNPPPNPAKLTDSRVGAYLRDFGEESWELDALDPATLDALIEEAVLEERDERRFESVAAQEEEGRERLAAIAERWTEIEAFLQQPPAP